MPRLNNAQELFRKLDTLQVFRQVGSTQSAAAAQITAGQAAVNFTSATGFTANDPIIMIGSGGAELNAITAVTPTTAVPLLYPAIVPNPSGTQILRAVATTLGEIEEGGIRIAGSAPLTPINSALQGAPIAYINGIGELTASLGLLGFNLLNLQTIFGVTEGEIGTGAASAPYQVAILGQNIGLVGAQCFRATGTRVDGATIQVDFNNARVEPQGEIPLQRTAAVPLPLLLKFSSMVVRQFN
jgi:hypothetical protein